MAKRLAVIGLLIVLSKLSFAQTVSISSDSFVCINEVISLQSSVTGAAMTYSWTLGDNSSSTQQNIQHSYSTIGQKTVELAVTFADGSTKKATKVLMVHGLPNANFSLVNSSFCIDNQRICIKDNSSMGPTTTGYQSRLILWGDGASSGSSIPKNGDTICYASYPKISPPTYTIQVEVINNKGCEAIWTKDIDILRTFKSSFKIQAKKGECARQEICFANDSTYNSSIIQSFEWDFGDGTKNTTDWSPCHFYTTLDTFKVSLKVNLKNECGGEKRIDSVITSFQGVQTAVNAIDTALCFPEPFRFTSLVVPDAYYNWQVYNTDSVETGSGGAAASTTLYVPIPGDYLVRLIISVNNCFDTSGFYKISSYGAIPDFRALNNNQCSSLDTAYLFNQSLVHPRSRINYSWNYDDTLANQCIGSTNNCNLDTSFHGKHFYHYTGCYTPTMYYKDLDYGCIDSFKQDVSTMLLQDAQFFWDSEKPCFGNKADYTINFGSSVCNSHLRVCKDSLVNDKIFKTPGEGDFIYTFTPSLDGFITVGLELSKGDTVVYNSADTNDFYIDYSRGCVDTFWQHKWFKLNNEPKANFTLSIDTNCLPTPVKLRYTGNEDAKIKQIRYRWAITENFQIKAVLPDTVPDITRTITDEGVYRMYFEIEDTNGCYNYRIFTNTFGYYNNFLYDSVLCVNETVILNDSLRYWGDTAAYWRRASRPEAISWNFDDGNGFSSSQNTPTISYPAKGDYVVRMASVDKNGCTDTVSRVIHVIGVNASIAEQNREFLCDQIIQFFDSSYFDIPNENDTIISYYWRFGDQTTDSYLEDPFHFYTKNGNYSLTHAVETEAGCKDTATFNVYLKGPEPFFEITSDTVGCVPYTASFKSTSKNVSTLIWYMGDGANSIVNSKGDTTFSFTYTSPGTYYIYTVGSDVFYNESTNNTYTCSAFFPDTSLPNAEVRRIVVLPIPSVAFTFNEPACVGQPTVFLSNSDTIYKTFNWSFDGKDTSTSQKTISYTFDKPGNFEVKLSPTYNPQGAYQRACFDTEIDSITVIDIEANFRFEADGVCNEFLFFDSSRNAESLVWDFDHAISGAQNSSKLLNPQHGYGKDSGTYNVCLYASNTAGCADTVCKDVYATYYEDLKLYNVFTPGNDNLNETFGMKIENYSFYYLQIFNRWGEQIFDTNDPEIGWDGTDEQTGAMLPSSTYFYVLKYSYACDSKEHLVEGSVDIIR